ncbi:MAG: hypothetical protein ACLP1X_29290 [Polyangiaceae bacterium]|jgi:hypothetical protein
MRPLPTLPVTTSGPIQQWSNFHHTIAGRAVPAYLTPGTPQLPAGAAGAAALTQALNAILTYCVADPPERLCTIGSRLSLSNILDPGDLILDPGIWNQIVAVLPAWLTDDYKSDAAARGGVPVCVQGGTNIRTLNDYLGKSNLALQASGASDNHRIAGCIATGTHGSHLKVGAVHDTVLGIYLVTGPNQALFLQPSRRRFTPDVAQWFQQGTTLATTDVADDDMFNAAKVALGALGFVHSVIVEAVPLYQLHGQTIARPLLDADVWYVIETLDTSRLDPTPSPDFFTVVFSPFAKSGSVGSYTTLLWKQPPSQPYTGAGPVQSAASTDLMRLLSGLISVVDSGATGGLIDDVVAAETAQQYNAGTIAPVFPGTYFGPTTLPEGDGRSSEVVVDHANARAAVQTVITTIQSEAAAGRTLLGGIGVRFVPATDALLGMNIHAMNTYIEFPSINSAETSAIQGAVWNALRTAGIPFTCHWGQEYGMDISSVNSYFGDRVARWKAARAKILPTAAARAVFTNPLVTQLGLDQ